MFLLFCWFTNARQVSVLSIKINKLTGCYIPKRNIIKTMPSLRLPIKVILIDLSGTLHIENAAIPGAVEALNKLRNLQIPIKFVTNTTKESRRYLYERLVNLGFQLQQDEIFSSLLAARDLIRSRNLKPMLMLEKEALVDFEGLIPENESEHNSVVVGLAPSMFNYQELDRAFRLLLVGAPLIAIHEGRYYKRINGLALGPGAFVKALEYSASCKSEVVGKPSPLFFKTALGDIDPSEALMIGDDVRDDIGGALALGMQAFLVQTGKYREGDENTISPQPTKVCSSFTEAVEFLLKECVTAELSAFLAHLRSVN